MDKKIEIFYVEHLYENDDEDEIKFIGLFSSRKKAQDVVNELIQKPGFRELPINCFKISVEILDRYGWKDGFTSWKDASENS